MKRMARDVSIKRRTRVYWQETLDALRRSRPELSGTEIRRITAGTCREWAARQAKVATPSRYNNTLSLLRRIIDVAIQTGVVHANAPLAWRGDRFARSHLSFPNHRGVRGYDTGKKALGRKRHSVVDSLGFILGVLVTPANVSGPAGAAQMLPELVSRFGWLRG